MNHENHRETVQNEDPRMVEVIQIAKELEKLLRQRAELTTRIQVAKQTIAGLASLFGTSVELEELTKFHTPRRALRQSGFTQACRELLHETSDEALNCRDFQERLKLKFPELTAHHKDLGASVTTVLNRLVRYGQAVATEDALGRRAWRRSGAVSVDLIAKGTVEHATGIATA